MEHTRTEDNRTQWDLCIYYSGRFCGEDDNVYCGLQHGGSIRGDSRVNMSLNTNTPQVQNVTIINSSTWTNLSWDVSDPDITLYGDSIAYNLTKWYINEVYNASYDNETSINITDLSCLNITVEVKSYDDAYFSPTGNEIWNETNNTITIPCIMISSDASSILIGLCLLVFICIIVAIGVNNPSWWPILLPVCMLAILLLTGIMLVYGVTIMPLLSTFYQVIMWSTIIIISFSFFLLLWETLTFVRLKKSV